MAKKGGWIPPGLSKQDQEDWDAAGGPPGWSRGRKVGWRGGNLPPGLAKKVGMPPGWKKWKKHKQKHWQENLDDASEDVAERIRELKELTEEDHESALISLRCAARRGVPVAVAKQLVLFSFKKGVKGPDVEKVTRALTYAGGRDIDFDPLGSYVTQKLNEGLRGDDLAIEVYREVNRRHHEKVNAKKESKPPDA